MLLSIYYYNCETQLKYILYSICIAFFLLLSQTNSIEGMTDLEAVSNVASLYNNQNMTVSNLNVTGKLTVNGLSKLSGIDNRNGITNDNLNMTGRLNLTDASNNSIMINGGQISLTNGNDKSIQTISNGWHSLNINTGESPSSEGSNLRIGGASVIGNKNQSGYINLENNFPTNTNKQHWMINNVNGMLRFWPIGGAAYIDTQYLEPNGSKLIQTSWAGSDGAYRSTIGTQPPCRSDRAQQDGAIYKYNSCGGNWNA